MLNSFRSSPSIPRRTGGVLAVAAAALIAGWPAWAQSSEPDGAVSSVIARFREEIPEIMAEQVVPGLALVLVDGDQVLWSEGFGRLERGGVRPQEMKFQRQHAEAPETETRLFDAGDGLAVLSAEGGDHRLDAGGAEFQCRMSVWIY